MSIQPHRDFLVSCVGDQFTAPHPVATGNEPHGAFQCQTVHFGSVGKVNGVSHGLFS